MTRLLLGALLLLGVAIGLAEGAQPVQPIAALQAAKPKGEVFPRGHKTPTAAVLKARHDAAFKRHDHRIRSLPRATPATYDLRKLGQAIPSQDQKSCGSCWDFSGCEVGTNAICKASAGAIPFDGSFFLSTQYVLDCGQNVG